MILKFLSLCKFLNICCFRINVRTEETNLIRNQYDENDERVIFLGDDKPILLKSNQRSRTTSETKAKSQKLLQEKSNFFTAQKVKFWHLTINF